MSFFLFGVLKQSFINTKCVTIVIVNINYFNMNLISHIFYVFKDFFKVISVFFTTYFYSKLYKVKFIKTSLLIKICI